jgi:hypothetical protein
MASQKLITTTLNQKLSLIKRRRSNVPQSLIWLIILYPELSFPLRSIHLCQRSFYKIVVKFRNSKKNVLKIVLIIVNINKDENKSLNFTKIL